MRSIHGVYSAGRVVRLGGLAALGLFLLWSIGPAQADAARCGGRKADVVGGGGDNVLKSDKHGVQVIVGGAGDDLIISKRNKDIICGGPGNDRIFSGTGRDKVYGGAGEDYLDEGPGSGKVWAAGGNDIVVGGGGGERIRGGSGNDRIFGEIQDDKIFGDSGDDLLVGGQGTDKLSAGAGNDWLRGDTNQDKYFGEAGDDTASFATATPPGPHPTRDGVVVSIPAGSSQGDDSQERLSGIENLIGSIFEDELTGAGGGYVRGLGGGDDCIGFSSETCPGNVGSAPDGLRRQPRQPRPGRGRLRRGFLGQRHRQPERGSAADLGLGHAGTRLFALGLGGGLPAAQLSSSDTCCCGAATATTRSAWAAASPPPPASRATAAPATTC